MGKRRRRRSTSNDFVYRSTYLHEADLVANELENAGIAFYRAEEPSWSPRGDAAVAGMGTGTSFLVN